MPHRPVLGAPRGGRVVSPAAARKRVTNREQMTRTQRGHMDLWLPSGQDYAIISDLANTAAISPKIGLATQKPPPNAVAFHVMVSVNANTVTTGSVRLNVYRFADGTLFTDTALTLSCPMFAASYSARVNGIVPISPGPGIWYGTTVSGTVAYDITASVVGYVLE